MDFTKSALVLLVVCWALQVAGSWVQWRHYQQSVMGNQRAWSEGYLGVGRARKKFGFGAIALVVVSKDMVVRRLQVMSGFSVFARFKDVPAYEGVKLDSLEARLTSKGTQEKIVTAVKDAIKRIEEVQGRT